MKIVHRLLRLEGQKGRGWGFTLIELLVVIAILAFPRA